MSGTANATDGAAIRRPARGAAVLFLMLGLAACSGAREENGGSGPDARAESEAEIAADAALANEAAAAEAADAAVGGNVAPGDVSAANGQ